MAAKRLLSVASKQKLFSNARRVAMFLTNDGEIDLRPLMRHAWRQGKKTYLPMLFPARIHKLFFARISDATPLRKNKYGIWEPTTPVSKWRKASELDLIFVPLVAFDETGNRIGMGGGYYDRTLAFLHSRQYWLRPKLIGVAHDFQRVEKIAAESWDIPLPAIVTDKALYQF